VLKQKLAPFAKSSQNTCLPLLHSHTLIGSSTAVLNP